jgi:ribosomal protein S18 acetylase RimI-like enzyme
MVSRSIGEVRLVPFDPAHDAGLVSTWLHAPHVSRWWGDPEKALAEILDRPSDGGDALIVAGGARVGYIRWQTPRRPELDAAGLHEVPDGAVDIDIAIGEREFVGLGIGPRALRQLVEGLIQDRGVPIPMIMLATSHENEAAVRAYEKAGFVRRCRFDDPECGDCWLLVLEVPPG